MERISATTADGVTLVLRRFSAPVPRRAVCLCTHAMMANGSYFSVGDDDGFAGHLARAGVETYVLDFRGHGESKPPHPERDRWCFDDYVELDLPAAIGAVCESADISVDELVFLGHSLGGNVGLAAFGTGTVPPPQRMALWATSLWLPGPKGSARRRLFMEIYRQSARLLGYAPIRRMRMGSDNEPRDYVDQLTGWARTGMWTSRTGIDYLAHIGNIDVPVWAVTGDGDRLCLPTDAMVMVSRLRGALPLRRVGVSRGDALDADHFKLFTKSTLAPLWDEMVAFATGGDHEPV